MKMLIENLTLISALLVGAWGLGYLGLWHPVAYLIFAGILHILVLRKIICTNCPYYNTTCPLGWSKIANFLFEKGSEDRFGEALKFDLPAWGITVAWPVAGMGLYLLNNFSMEVVIVLLLFVFLMLGMLTMLRSWSCTNCQNREDCFFS